MAKTATETTSTELVAWQGCKRPIPAFLTALPWAQTDEQAINDIIERILKAETVADVIAKSSTNKFETLYGSVITIHGFRMMPSDLDDGCGAFALVDYTLDGNTEHQLTTTSALGVLAQLSRTYQLSGFPLRCAVCEIDTGKNGKNNPVYLGPVSEGEEAF